MGNKIEQKGMRWLGRKVRRDKDHITNKIRQFKVNGKVKIKKISSKVTEDLKKVGLDDSEAINGVLAYRPASTECGKRASK